MRRRSALALVACLALGPLAWAGRASVGGPIHDGVRAVCDLPAALQLRNVGGTDGAGLCVWTSLEHAARWASIAPLIGVRKRMEAEPGGGWPERVDRVMRRDAPDVPYVQYLGPDPAVLDLAIKTGRMPSITYGYGERYGNQTIAHMVNLAHLDGERAAIVDNNFPGTWEWMDRQEFIKRWRHNNPGGNAWAVVLLPDPPPPPPK